MPSLSQVKSIWQKNTSGEKGFESRTSLSPKVFTPQADLNYALIRRENPKGKVSILSFSPNLVLSENHSDEDLILLPADTLIILSRSESSKRQRQIRPLLEELRYTGQPGQGVPSVNVAGMVHFPGEYPFTLI